MATDLVLYRSSAAFLETGIKLPIDMMTDREQGKLVCFVCATYLQ
jgi:hypothetical protein